MLNLIPTSISSLDIWRPNSWTRFKIQNIFFNSKNFGVCPVIAKLSSDNQDVAVSLLANTPSKGKNVRC